jgi:hypothetical protein
MGFTTPLRRVDRRIGARTASTSPTPPRTPRCCCNPTTITARWATTANGWTTPSTGFSTTSRSPRTRTRRVIEERSHPCSRYRPSPGLLLDDLAAQIVPVSASKSLHRSASSFQRRGRWRARSRWSAVSARALRCQHGAAGGFTITMAVLCRRGRSVLMVGKSHGGGKSHCR